MKNERKGEIWKQIDEFGPRYHFSNFGRVYSSKASRCLIPQPTKKGYTTVCIKNIKGKSKKYGVHVLICWAFRGPKPGEEYEVNHKNRIKDDNRSRNLEWITKSENVRHAFKFGCYPGKKLRKPYTYKR